MRTFAAVFKTHPLRQANTAARSFASLAQLARARDL